MTEKDVHTEHCCIVHGCKYGEDDTCPVTTGQKPQSYPCEDCDTSIMTEFKWGDLKECMSAVNSQCEWEILAASSIYEDQTTERPCGSRVILRCKHCGDVKQKKMMS